MYAVNRFSLSSLRSLDRLASRLVVLDLHRAVIPGACQSRNWILRVTKTTGILKLAMKLDIFVFYMYMLF